MRGGRKGIFSHLSESCRSLNAGIAAERPLRATKGAKPSVCSGANPKRLRGDDGHASGTSCLNATEKKFLEWLENSSQRYNVLSVQPKNVLRFPNGDHYNPDFMTVDMDGKVVFWECKGGYRGPGAEQGYERYKRAAERWSGNGVTFVMATLDRGTGEFELLEWRK